MDYLAPCSSTPKAQKDPHHSAAVQRRIDAAFTLIGKVQRMEAFPLARAILGLDMLMRKMSRWQRMDVLYVFGQAYCAEERRDLGIPVLEDALTLATGLHDAVAIADIGEPLGLACRCVGQSRRAVDHLELAFGSLNDPGAESDFSYPSPEHLRSRKCAVAAHIGSNRAGLGHYPSAAVWHAEAELLSHGLPEYGIERGLVAWCGAILNQWRGNLEPARRYAERASEIYARRGSADASARIRSITAQIALDLAAPYPPYSSVYDEYVSLAKHYADGTFSEAADAGDAGGASMGMLAWLRLLRFLGENENRSGLIMTVAREASRVGDTGLASHALVVLGEDLEATDERESARSIYVRAVDAIPRGDLGAYRDQARRRLQDLDAN